MDNAKADEITRAVRDLIVVLERTVQVRGEPEPHIRTPEPPYTRSGPRTRKSRRGPDIPRACRHWTTVEDFYLRAHYVSDSPLEDLAKELGREENAISKRASKLGLRRPWNDNSTFSVTHEETTSG